MKPGKSPEENEDHDDHDDDKDNDQRNHRLFSSGVRWRRLPWPGPSLSISSLIQIFIVFSTLIRPSLEGMEIVGLCFGIFHPVWSSSTSTLQT